jgi:2-methylcitrate dehydratase PrpD
MTKYLHCAKANYNGMFAAALAKRGLTGARKILEGDRGLLKATSTTENPGKFFETCGKEYRILTAGYKPWPSCRHTHTAIEACMNLRTKYDIIPENIKHIQVDTYLTATQVAKNNLDFDSVRAAKFSISYCTAIALTYGEVTVTMVNDLLYDKQIRSLVASTTVTAEEEMEMYRPEKMPARVTVLLKDGTACSDIVLLPKGEPSNPFTEDEIDKKYMSLAAPVIGEEKAKVLLSRCRSLEQMEDVADLFSGL